MAKQTNGKRIVIVLVIVLVGLAVAWACGRGGVQFGPVSLFMLCAVSAFLINWLAFVPANAAKTEHFYDLTGSITYLSVVGMAIVLTPEVGARAVVAASLVTIWTLRLGIFLFRRINLAGQDDRFTEIKADPLRFLIAWSLQGLWVILTAACALVIITGGQNRPIGWVGMIGIALWVIGFAIEVIADNQKSRFKADPENKGKFINVGLWSWSRHPNYFGEILLWTGMAVLAIPVLSGWQWVAMISPIFVALLLTKVSGIPMLAEKGLKRWGHDPAYQAYLKNTSLLVPMPPSRDAVSKNNYLA